MTKTIYDNLNAKSMRSPVCSLIQLICVGRKSARILVATRQLFIAEVPIE